MTELLGVVGLAKAWLFVQAAVGAFPPGPTPLAAALTAATLVALVVFASATIWAAGGATLRRLLDDPRAQRPVAITLSVVVAASVAFIWV